MKAMVLTIWITTQGSFGPVDLYYSSHSACHQTEIVMRSLANPKIRWPKNIYLGKGANVKFFFIPCRPLGVNYADASKE